MAAVPGMQSTTPNSQKILMAVVLPHGSDVHRPSSVKWRLTTLIQDFKIILYDQPFGSTSVAAISLSTIVSSEANQFIVTHYVCVI